MTINLKIPDAMSELKPRITVFGVGGAGGNAVNNMIQEGLDGVEFVVANTDAQALAMSSAERRIQMGTSLTEGLGAGSQPKIGAAAAQEAQAEILDYSAGSHMVFITAGMGGGTGTGAAPVIAQLCKEQGILTVAVVTKPFQFEGVRRMQIADEGIEELSKYVDTLIVIPNQNLFRIANEKTTFSDAFAMADQVLLSGVSGITDLMVKEGLINLDFADVKSIMQGMGKAMMGTGEASGEKRAVEAAEAAISNPLLDDVSMKGAQGLLISITGGEDLTLFEVDEVATRIRNEVDNNANIILGATFDSNLEGSIKVSVVATGIQSNVKNIDSTSFTFNKNYSIPRINQNQNNSDETSKVEEKSNSLSQINNSIENKIEEIENNSEVSIKKIDQNHSFFKINSNEKSNQKQTLIKDFSDFDHANNSKSTEATDIPRVSDFFSIKEDNISFAMNESLLDKDTKKAKNSLFSKIVNVGFKKKELNNDLLHTNEQYSQVAMNADSKILSDNEVSDLNNEVDNSFDNEFLSDDEAQFDDFQNKIENELNEDQISNPLHKDE
ncbi:MAG: cell division protein FtsZ, partial [Hyphomicrobiales bacterium]